MTYNDREDDAGYIKGGHRRVRAEEHEELVVVVSYAVVHPRAVVVLYICVWSYIYLCMVYIYVCMVLYIFVYGPIYIHVWCYVYICMVLYIYIYMYGAIYIYGAIHIYIWCYIYI
jgi:hypothetical protein